MDTYLPRQLCTNVLLLLLLLLCTLHIQHTNCATVCVRVSEDLSFIFTASAFGKCFIYSNVHTVQEKQEIQAPWLEVVLVTKEAQQARVKLGL